MQSERLGSGQIHNHGLRLVVGVASAYALLGGLLTLAGWAFEAYRLTDWGNTGISMKTNAAMAAALAGAALLLRQFFQSARGPAVGLGFFVASIGGLSLLQHLTGWDLGIDTLLFYEAPGALATSAPGRIGIPASTAFLIIGIAIFSLTQRARAREVTAALGVAAIAIGALSLVGYFYGASPMYALPHLTGIAMQTASMIFALGIAIVASVPECEPMRTLLERSGAGLVTRKALPFVIVVPLLVGRLRVWVQEQGLVDTAFGTALRTVVELALMAVLVWWAAASVRAYEVPLLRRERDLSDFFDNATVGLHWVGPDGLILRANKTELDLLGYQREEYLGHHIAEFHVDAPVIAEILRSLTCGETLREHPARLRCKNGSIKHVLINSNARFEDGRFVHTRCFTLDVTEAKRVEEELRSAQLQLQRYADSLEMRVSERTADLQTVNEQLETFACSIAHDLRSPLRGMMGYSQILLEEYAEGLDETGQTLLKRIQKSSEFMDKLLLDLLAFGRAARSELELQDVAVQKAWEAALFQIATQAEQTKAQIEVIGEFPFVRAHEATLGQCIANLLSNALKFMPPGVQPHIRFRAEATQRAGESQSRIRLWVEDNGIGIAPEFQDRAFRVFERLNGPLYAGTGMGLTIVRQSIQRMGGDVGLESEIGKGSRFWIELAAADLRPQAQSPAPVVGFGDS